ncbi:hypothetical protein JW906_05635 [bacterium]|nr:hypothetical protein [bacterium]
MKAGTNSFTTLLLLLMINTQGICQSHYPPCPDSIDLIILQEANHLWDIFGNEIWQYYHPEDMPVLLFNTPEQHWLLNHPDPPENFHKLVCCNTQIDAKTSGCDPLWYYFSATIWPINHCWTTIIPSLSACNDFCAEHHLPDSFFPPDLLVFITLHERFHNFQIKWLENDYLRIFNIEDSESPRKEKHDTLSDIPDDSPKASLCLEEQAALYKAYIEQDTLKAKGHIREFLNLRHQNGRFISEVEKETENFMEFVEGTAKYIEFQLSESIQDGYRSIDRIRNHKQFNNYTEVVQSPRLFIEKAQTGDLTSSRFYSTGIILCKLLDRFSEKDWKKDLFKNYHEKKIDLCKLLSGQI